MRVLARLLAAAETEAALSAAAGGGAVFPAIDKLRMHLSTLMGQSGFQALLSRALTLAAAEISWLATLRVTAHGELEGLAGARQAVADAAVVEGEVALLAHLLGLLVAFIGPALTLRLIGQVWPQLSFDDTDFSTPADDEDAH